MNKVLFLLTLKFIVLFSSCDLLRDSPYKVEAWTPGGGFHDQTGKIVISLLLSGESDRIRTEQAFLLTEDNKTVKGDFLWEGKKLIFIPAFPPESGRDYLISLGTGAQDTKGLSLETKFEAYFTTRSPGGKPAVIGTYPDHEENLSESRGEYRVFFSEPVHLDSCIDNISFSPSTAGSWKLEDENKTACFTPREPWQKNSLYRVTVDSNFYSLSGSALGSAYSSVFYSGEDREKPVLLNAFASVSGGEFRAAPVSALTIEKSCDTPKAAYTNWESFTGLELVFSEPVDLNSLKNLLSTEPFHSLVMESQPEILDRAVFRFADYPAWGSSVILRLAPGVKDKSGNESKEEYLIRISFSGPLSKPPVLAGIRLPMAPGNAGNQELLSFTRADVFRDLPVKNGEDRYPYAQKIPSWIELYFDTAAETEIDLFSVMDLFRVESTNQAVSFSPRSVVTKNFTCAAPEEGWEKFQRIEIQGFFTNTVHTGIVTFRIPAGLTDKRGNRSTEDFRISLLK